MKEEYFPFENILEHTKKKFILVVYDISDNKRRTKISVLLESYGYRVQKSVFEIMIEKKKIQKLIKEIERLVKEEDHVKIYMLRGVEETYSWGMEETTVEQEIIII